MERAPEGKEVGYVPGLEFQEDNKESLIDIEMDEDTELWLIQLPDDQVFLSLSSPTPLIILFLNLLLIH